MNDLRTGRWSGSDTAIDNPESAWLQERSRPVKDLQRISPNHPRNRINDCQSLNKRRRQITPQTNTRMKTNQKTFQAAIIGALLLLSGCATSRHSTGAWEYRVIQGWTSQRAEFEKQLNDAGREGYVVVSSSGVPAHGDTGASTVVILKRHKP